MTKYRVMVTEILSRVVEVESECEEDAINMARKMYRNCDIVLDASDYKETNICIKDEK